MREVSCRFTIAVAAALVGLTIAAVGASAAMLTVNMLDDSTAASGECSGAPSDCSLRQALDKATAGDTIDFDVTGTIMLTAANGPLPVSNTVTINGPGASQLTIDGGANTQILNSSGGPQLTISGLTLQNGSATEGGAIYVHSGRLVLRSDSFVDDTAQGGTGAGLGGAIATDSGFGTVSVKDSSFTGDSATGTGGISGGGAIYVDGPLSIEDSTFTGNSVTDSGGTAEGGVVDLTTGPGAISNSTFTGNTAGGSFGEAGALYVPGATLTDDTIDHNTANGVGGGVGPAGVVAYGTIFSNNDVDSGGTVFKENCAGPLANAASTTSYNLEGPGAHICLQGGPSVDPMLGSLAANGGPTQTQAITPRSPAYGDVPAAVCQALPFLQVDQRGLPRSGTGETNCDIGAYEFQAAATVTSLESSVNPSPAGGQVSFTAAVSPAPDGGTVAFTDGSAAISGCGAVPTSPAGQASCQVTYPAAGLHPIVATYSSDPTFAPSGSPTLDEVVQSAQPVQPPVQPVQPPAQPVQPPAQPVQPAPTAGPGSVGTASVGKVTVNGGHVTTSVTCMGSSGSSCSIKLSLSAVVRGDEVTAAAASHRSVRKKTVIVGITKEVTLAAGKTEKLAVSLNGAGRQMLTRHQELGVKLAIVQFQNGSGRSIFTRTVTFKEPKQK